MFSISRKPLMGIFLLYTLVAVFFTVMRMLSIEIDQGALVIARSNQVDSGMSVRLLCMISVAPTFTFISFDDTKITGIEWNESKVFKWLFVAAGACLILQPLLSSVSHFNCITFGLFFCWTFPVLILSFSRRID